MIVFGAVRPGRTSLGIFLTCPPPDVKSLLSPLVVGGCYVPPPPQYFSCRGLCGVCLSRRSG